MSQENEKHSARYYVLMIAAGSLIFVLLGAGSLAGGILLRQWLLAPPPGEQAAGREDPDVSVAQAAPANDRQAPNFTLHDLEGNEVSLADYLGRPVVINFWATWCVPCEAEMPLINEAYQTYKDDGLAVLALDFMEHPDTVRSFVDYYQLTFTILTDREGSAADDYRVNGLPTTFFIDRSGNIAHFYIGQMSEADLEAGLAKIR
jgi:peroxiredoxin